MSKFDAHRHLSEPRHLNLPLLSQLHNVLPWHKLWAALSRNLEQKLVLIFMWGSKFKKTNEDPTKYQPTLPPPSLFISTTSTAANISLFIGSGTPQASRYPSAPTLEHTFQVPSKSPSLLVLQWCLRWMAEGRIDGGNCPNCLTYKSRKQSNRQRWQSQRCHARWSSSRSLRFFRPCSWSPSCSGRAQPSSAFSSHQCQILDGNWFIPQTLLSLIDQIRL